jgi:hypothetical protein
MSTAEVARRITLLFAATVLLVAALAFVAGGYRTVADTLPARLSDKEFWTMVNDFSEAGGYFRSDNFLSNETGYQAIIPALRKSTRSGGVYLGVGPEQNFTYIVGLEPKMAFIVDIRRQNMLEHLLYKALMEMSAGRVEFLSRLFSRPQPASLHDDATPEVLVRAYEHVQADGESFERNVTSVLEYLEKKRGFELSSDDEAGVRKVYQAFFESGPDLSYTFLGGYGSFMGMPTYGDLMTENDGYTRNWNFLATDGQYQMIRGLQERNLIVPLVGDFAGPKAIRSVATYLKKHDAFLTAFYTSNVEQYLFQDDENWKNFYENVGALPIDSSSTFIRYVLNSWRYSRRSRTLVSPIGDVVHGYNRGRIRSYYDIVEMSR